MTSQIIWVIVPVCMMTRPMSGDKGLYQKVAPSRQSNIQSLLLLSVVWLALREMIFSIFALAEIV